MKTYAFLNIKGGVGKPLLQQLLHIFWQVNIKNEYC